MARSREIFTFGFRGFPGIQGGIENHVSELAPRLVAGGHRVTACFRAPYISDTRLSEWRGVRLLRLWTLKHSHLETIVHSFLCAAVACVRRPALVHIHGIGPALVTPIVRLFGIPVVVTHHGADYEREKWGRMARWVLRSGEALGMRFASRRIVLNQSTESQVRTRYGKECAVIPNGVRVPELPRRSDRVEKLALDPGRYILLVGRLVPEKRQLDAVRAFAASRPAGWKLVIVGQIDHASRYADRLTKEAETTENVVMAGLRAGEDLNQLYAHAGLFVLPSSHEGLPIALLEALSYGIPTLVSDIPANRELITDPARIFAVGDVDALATRFSALEAQERAPFDRETSRRDCARRFDWDAIARRTAAVYAEAVREPARWSRKPRRAGREA